MINANEKMEMGLPEGKGGRREQILQAAAGALARVGYEKITTRRIASEAGVNVATLHYYFGTKEQLLTEAVRFSLTKVERLLRSAITDAPSPAAALRAGYEMTWAILRERPGVLRYDLVLRALREPDARREADVIYGAYRRLVEEVAERHMAAGGTLAEGVTPQVLSQFVVATVDGILLHHLIVGDDAITKRTLDLALRHALALMNVRMEHE